MVLATALGVRDGSAGFDFCGCASKAHVHRHAWLRALMGDHEISPLLLLAYMYFNGYQILLEIDFSLHGLTSVHVFSLPIRLDAMD
jgi:hypothetical protein